MREEIDLDAGDDPSEALMREVGAQLREVRQERGEDLDEIADYLRIRPIYLYGIERGDMGVMPGRTYALGFLRTYADYLGFDGEDLIEQIKSTVGNLTDRPRLHVRTPLHESRLPKMPLIVLSLAMITGIYAGWTWLNRDDRDALEQLPLRPEELAPPPQEEAAPAGPVGDAADEPATDPEPAAVAPPAPPPSEPAPEEPAVPVREAGSPAEPEIGGEADAVPEDDERGIAEVAPEAGPDEAEAGLAPDERPPGEDPAAPSLDRSDDPGPASSADETDEVGALIDQRLRSLQSAAAEARRSADQPRPPGDAVEPAGDDPTSSEVPAEASAAVRAVIEAAADGGSTVHETVNVDSRVILRALGESWMQIRSTSGDYLRTRTLAPGDTFLVPNRDDLVLWTGNVGAIEFLVDGERIAPLGPAGQVMRDIPLGPAALLERASQPG